MPGTVPGTQGRVLSKADMASWCLQLERQTVTKYRVVNCDKYMKEEIDGYQWTEDVLPETHLLRLEK